MNSAPSDRIGSGHSSQELALANWWVRNRLSLRTLGYAALIAWVSLTWLYGLWTLFDTFALSYPKEQRYAARIALIAPTAASNEVSAPIPLEIGPTTVLTSGDRRHFLAQLHNSNRLWWAEVRYRFREGGVASELQSLILLPEDTRIATDFNNKNAGLHDPSLSIESISWKRLDPNLIQNGDFAGYKAERYQLTVDRPTYQSDIELEGKRMGQSIFTLRNPSGIRYRSVELLTLLYRDGALIGAQKYVLPYVEPASNQEIRLGWPDNPLAVSRVEVQPFINLLDPDSFPHP